MPKCEIFDLLDFRDFFPTKPLRIGELGTKIKKYCLLNFLGL